MSSEIFQVLTNAMLGCKKKQVFSFLFTDEETEVLSVAMCNTNQ